MYTDLPEIAKISAPKWRAHLSGCQEAPIDFGALLFHEFLRYGNISIVAVPDVEKMSGGLSQ